ncbi:hypothetical protein ACG0Z3_04270 [Roseateles sp. LKC17W]|uniref:Uncharacterized protein n=1 Tax=Pelomonas margarita TaxID=3299031 RepID=A0ABW7FE51_9BURK
MSAAAMASEAPVTTLKLSGRPMRMLPSHCAWRASSTSWRKSGSAGLAVSEEVCAG